ncbi:DUF262 domain-containing protein [[Flexibacter] sp. ATCC 35208]|uniref:DUF262 domain-containing protein n=1 Tax=[Flexibacter] sp. ATCC 35208 TaxID=1936242 RepID=UPI0009CF1E7A|nr:DUF262 domain-containing protein [[Flexibacter] sp. ATCC 35208]OMP75083.1 hypothetical protein BW716_31940 [[Flexibacter] sp. ATCC 35208]
MRKYTLPDLLNGTIDVLEQGNPYTYNLQGIQIPMIQRDYAQGRPQEYRIRKRFLDALFNAVISGDNFELDFIYGAIEELDGKQILIPLDGQQRLTALFLLYWYISNRELYGRDLTNMCDLLSRFSYSTRASAREFCERLCSIRLSFDVLPSKEIGNSVWYYEVYRLNPTVASMLVVLDEIHERYDEGGRQLFPLLSKVTFYILPLKSFSLTDELYIKMNARGKQLSDFENFKADFIKWVQGKANGGHPLLAKRVVYDGREMSYHMAFSLKLDNEWTRLFWNYAKDNDPNIGKVVDGGYFRFWNWYLFHHFLGITPSYLNSLENQKPFWERFVANNQERYTGFDEFAKVFENSDVVSKIERVLDGLSIHHSEINELLQPAWPTKQRWHFFGENATFSQRIIYYSVTRFLEEIPYDRVAMQRWLRVVWNLAIDPDVRSYQNMWRVMRLVDKMAVGVEDIYSFLLQPACEEIIKTESSFLKNQLLEEVVKAKFILSNGDWESSLIKAEGHPLFMGNIRFLLSDDEDVNEFLHRSNSAMKIFSGSGPQGPFAKDYMLMRAYISQIQTWSDLLMMNLKDYPDNWKLILRRKADAMDFVQSICSLPDETSQVELMNELIDRSSTLDESNVFTLARHMHEKLYQHADFHYWLQNLRADKGIELKWYENNLYVHRPGSWYDRVMLNSFRNEIITLMIQRFDFTTHNQCGDAPFYWDYDVTLYKKLDSEMLVADFLRDGKLVFHLLEDLEPSEIQEMEFSYGYSLVESIDGVEPFVDRISSEIFDEDNQESMLLKIRNFMDTQKKNPEIIE